MNIEKFENNLIAFDFENEMVNATDMAKRYGKRPNDFLNLDSTKAFIEILKSDTIQNGITYFEPIITIKGNYSDGKSQGTWMNKLLAFKFAAWLNPEFELFVYKVFDNFYKKLTALQNERLKEQNDKLKMQQYQIDYFLDKEDQKDLYRK